MPRNERPVELLAHALFRMRQRDILEAEVVALVRSHRAAKTIGRNRRIEVRGRVGRKQLLVVYERRASVDLVVSAMWE